MSSTPSGELLTISWARFVVFHVKSDWLGLVSFLGILFSCLIVGNSVFRNLRKLKILNVKQFSRKLRYATFGFALPTSTLILRKYVACLYLWVEARQASTGKYQNHRALESVTPQGVWHPKTRVAVYYIAANHVTPLFLTLAPIFNPLAWWGARMVGTWCRPLFQSSTIKMAWKRTKMVSWTSNGAGARCWTTGTICGKCSWRQTPRRLSRRRRWIDVLFWHDSLDAKMQAMVRLCFLPRYSLWDGSGRFALFYIWGIVQRFSHVFAFSIRHT